MSNKSADLRSGANRKHFIRGMFGEIAGRYDLLNRLLTFGRDRHWRRELVSLLDPQPQERALDLACGTGDQGRALLDTEPGVHLVSADPVSGMLRLAGGKIPAAGLVCCEAEALPFPAHSFQLITIAFGVRNFTLLEASLKELHRVLAPGGRLGVLEFAVPRSGPLAPLYRWYLKWVLPRVGGLLSRSYAYRYLTESIEQFPDPDRFIRLLESIGFSGIATRNFLGGTVWIYRGIKNGED